MNFSQKISRLTSLIRLWRLLAAVLALATVTFASALVFGALDAQFAFETTTRSTLTGIILATLAVMACLAFLKAISIRPHTIANSADASLNDPRQSISGALSLPAPSSPTALATFLYQQSQAEAMAKLATVKVQRIMPWRALLTPIFALTILALATLALHHTNPNAFSVVSNRILHPNADIPPYSKLQFNLSETPSSTTYGSNLDVKFTISGESPDLPVELLVRNPTTGESLRLPTFRSNQHTYTRSLDNLTTPVLVAAACGSARSPWMPIEVLLQPNILSGTIQVTPPPYTQIPPSEFALDSNEISAPAGSSISLTLVSNRPLSSGSLTLTPTQESSQAPTTIASTKCSSHQVAFSWKVSDSCKISATIVDVLNTPCKQPLTLQFRVVPDLPPNVAISSPPPLLLATSKSIIPITGLAEDDFSLSKIHLIRTLHGFRDRAQPVATNLSQKQFPFQSELNLDEIGAQPGDTIEVILEASDANPSLLGQASSNVSKIRIISDADYAKIIRYRTTLTQYQNRFNAVLSALDDARSSLSTLEKSIQSSTPDQIQEAASHAAQAHQVAIDLLTQIATDFPAFKQEQKLKDFAQSLIKPLNENLTNLQNLDSTQPKPDLLALIQPLIGRIAPPPTEKPLRKEIEAIDHMGQILAFAAEFRRILESQANLTGRLNVIRLESLKGIRNNMAQLPPLGNTQQKTRTALLTLHEQMEKFLKSPDALEALNSPLGEDTQKFIAEWKKEQPESMMDMTTQKAHLSLPSEAFDFSSRALNVLNRLCNLENNQFAAAILGQKPQLDENLDIQKALEELLESFLKQALDAPDIDPLANPNPQPNDKGNNDPQAPPQANHQRGNHDGFSQNSNIPLLGPNRHEVQSKITPAMPQASTSIKDHAAPLPTHAETSTIKPSSSTNPSQSKAPIQESIPDHYRDAVKKFLAD